MTIDDVLVRDYGYDANGNRLTFDPSQATPIASYAAQDRLESHQATTYEYTDNGVLFNWTGSGGGTSTLLDMTPYSDDGSTGALAGTWAAGSLPPFFVAVSGLRPPRARTGAPSFFLSCFLLGIGWTPEQAVLERCLHHLAPS